MLRLPRDSALLGGASPNLWEDLGQGQAWDGPVRPAQASEPWGEARPWLCQGQVPSCSVTGPPLEPSGLLWLDALARSLQLRAFG